MTRHTITLAGGAPHTLADLLTAEIARMSDGNVEYVINGVPFTIYYDERQALGDDGQPVHGDVTGEYELHAGVDGPLGLDRITDVHVGPHGTSRYGNAAAKPYAARQVALAMARVVFAKTRSSA